MNHFPVNIIHFFWSKINLSYKQCIIISGVLFLKVSFSHISHSAFLILTQNVSGIYVYYWENCNSSALPDFTKVVLSLFLARTLNYPQIYNVTEIQEELYFLKAQRLYEVFFFLAMALTYLQTCNGTELHGVLHSMIVQGVYKVCSFLRECWITLRFVVCNGTKLRGCGRGCIFWLQKECVKSVLSCKGIELPSDS